ncbi:hypothetical protein [Corallococcus sp. CA049B]|uniref:hypothetical protein n=1 Tax=Corallococcus sp. CA049B TaxID=2316730 RepID=UPI0011C3AB70|nr:hypothetical protein [Corallococcus sp. CA049B]
MGDLKSFLPAPDMSLLGMSGMLGGTLGVAAYFVLAPGLGLPLGWQAFAVAFGVGGGYATTLRNHLVYGREESLRESVRDLVAQEPSRNDGESESDFLWRYSKWTGDVARFAEKYSSRKQRVLRLVREEQDRLSRAFADFSRVVQETAKLSAEAEKAQADSVKSRAEAALARVKALETLEKLQPDVGGRELAAAISKEKHLAKMEAGYADRGLGELEKGG